MTLLRIIAGRENNVRGDTGDMGCSCPMKWVGTTHIVGHALGWECWAIWIVEYIWVMVDCLKDY